MSWTKRQFVTEAFTEIGYAEYAYDLEPEQLQVALRRLDAMMGSWNGKGISIGYPIPTSPENGDLDDETEVPDFANEAIYLSLAVRLAPTVGKLVSAETKSALKSAYNTVLKNITMPGEMRFPKTLPSGAGNKPWQTDDPFIREDDDMIVLSPDNEVNFNG